jgi:hypothetical protein
MSNTVLVFNPDGTGECLWTEALPLSSIGKLAIRRASQVEFSHKTQQWEVWIETGDAGGVRLTRRMFKHKSRERCIEWEREYFNKQLAQSA